MSHSGELPRAQMLAICLIVVAALMIRLIGIEDHSISHPEVYAPGIELAEDISEPPPRYEIQETFSWHFHYEPHPVGYYMGMLVWTSVFGTSEFSLRFPSAVLGALSALFVFLIGRRVYGPYVGLLAAGLLALHGFHWHWSQVARMYVPGTFLGLLSTWVLLNLIEAKTARARWEIGYVLLAIVGTQTVEFFWPFLAVHMTWIFFVQSTSRPFSMAQLWKPQFSEQHRLVQVGTIAIMLSAPALSHAAYLARRGAAGDPSVEFIIDYFGFGFLFARDEFAVPTLSLALPLSLLVLALSTAVLSLGLVNGGKRDLEKSKATSLPSWLMPVCAGVGFTIMLVISFVAFKRNALLMGLSVLPLLALLIPRLMVFADGILSFAVQSVAGKKAEGATPAQLIGLLAIFPATVAYLISFAVQLLAARAFLIFVPYVCLIAAAGVALIVRLSSKQVGAAAALGLIAVFASSFVYSQSKQNSPRDYKLIGAEIVAKSKPGDLVFVRKHDWVDTPLQYYLPSETCYVADNYAEALARHPSARVWLVWWPDAEYDALETIERRIAALEEYKMIETIEALRSRLDLYEPKDLDRIEMSAVASPC